MLALRIGLLAVLLAGCGTGGVLPGASATPSPTPRPPTASVPAEAIVLEARNRTFLPTTLEGVADQPTIVAFTNHDADNHALAVYRNAAQDEQLFRADPFSGPGTTVIYELPALPAGEYYFNCTVHPSMHGTLVIGPAPSPLPSASP